MFVWSEVGPNPSLFAAERVTLTSANEGHWKETVTYSSQLMSTHGTGVMDVFNKISEFKDIVKTYVVTDPGIPSAIAKEICKVL